MGGITVVTSVRGRLEDEFVEIHLREIHQKSVIYLISASRESLSAHFAIFEKTTHCNLAE